jgi:hypothetical protein
MNIQTRISRLNTNLTHIETLLDKEVWTTEETSNYGNKMMLSVERDLVEVSIQLCVIEFYLDKPSKDWTDDEKDKYGNKEQLREEKKQLRKKEELLREEKKQLRMKEEQLREKQTLLLQKKEMTNAAATQGIKFLS